MAGWTPYPVSLPEEPKARTQLHEEHPDLDDADGLFDNAMRVYSLVKQAETEAEEPLDIIRSRLVGYFVLYSPSSQSLSAIVGELRSFPAGSFNERCYQLGDDLLEQFVRPFHKRRCDRNTRFSDGQAKKKPLTEMEETAPRDPVSSRLAALIRDCFRCQATDTLDLDSVIHISSVRKLASDHPELMVDVTDSRHIIPDFDYDPPFWDSPTNNETQWKFWERFGHPELRGELAQSIHRLENVVTLRADICEYADDLRLCLKPVNALEDTYDCIMFGPDADLLKRASRIPNRKTFLFHRANKMPKPDVKYLRILTTCCFIANLSGALEYNDELTRVVNDW